MLRDEKWIAYAVRTLEAVKGGANSTNRIANDINASQSYLAKVVATLRKNGLIATTGELGKPLDKITIGELIDLADVSPVDDTISKVIVDHLKLSATTLSVQDVLTAAKQANGLAIS